MNEKKEIIKKEEKLDVFDPKTFQKFLDQEKIRRQLLKEYISDQLIESIDFGKIEMKNKKTGKTFVTKPVLFKAGAEKFISLLRLKTEWIKDEETLLMIPKYMIEDGIICYKCILRNQEGEFISEGRGACSLKEKDYSANNAIKITKKRAMVDAVLNLGLSDSFTQDLEEMGEVKEPKLPEADDIVTFGKYGDQNMKFVELPMHYLKWLRDNSNTEEAAINMQKIMDKQEEILRNAKAEMDKKHNEEMKKENQERFGEEFKSPIDDAPELKE